MILVSAQGPNPSLFFFGGTFIQLGGLFGQGLGLGLGPGLDNIITLKDVVDATHKVVYEAFNELSEKDKTAFLSEYRQRVEAAHVSVR